MRELIWRLRAMWRRHRAGAETHDELQFHHDMAVEAGLRRGLSPEDARRYARLGIAPASLTSAVTAAVHAVDPDLPLAEVRRLEGRASAALASRRFALWLFQAFAVLALVLSAAGIYGLLAYIVRQRRKELSIRVALGARRTQLWRMVLSDGMKMASIGALCCLVLIPLGGSLLQTFLYNVKAFDLVTVAGAPAALLIVAFLASLAPARSAMRSDPSQALRED
jgi:macrolide transport system ATP-binding/permease protein